METDQPLSPNKKIVEALSGKSNVKSLVFDRTLDMFNELKELLAEISNDLDEALDEIKESGVQLSRRVKLEYRDKGRLEAELRFADDVLVFSMLPDIYQFEPDHPVWKVPYAAENQFNTYCGIITVYNFLYESVKLNRDCDPGYLVARLFVNREGAFFVEGKNQPRKKIGEFGKVKLNKKELRDFVESAMLYALSFDLFVPPFEKVKSITVGDKDSDDYKIETGKRNGYHYNTDDVLE
ncbi:MAG: hypothetical protein IKZ50_00595 [Bacteroidales bacterium]|nr:hypothetical protein [Bacteroidales bacterium]MBR5906876.1 hypothetical protein [Bacteroidales bacterium]